MISFIMWNLKKKKIVELIDWILPGAGGWGKWRDIGQR